MNLTSNIPNDFYCPISLQLMKNPYVSKYGHSFEYDEIKKWIEQQKKCPITRKSLTLDEIFPNTSLRNSIDDIQSKISVKQLKPSLQAQQNDHFDKISIKSFVDSSESELMVSINMPEHEKRQPIDVLLCIDISGSMASDATLKSSTGENISHGISVLSLTICATKTILHSLQEQDTISIVTYSTQSQILISNQSITESNVEHIKQKLDLLKANGTTNLWSGIYTSLECLKNFSSPDKNKVIMLLTDGLPSEHQLPTRGIEYMLEKYYEENKNYIDGYDYTCMINTFGFGYSLDSYLLDNISRISGGDGFNYIPDSGLIGNIMIHSTGNSLTTAIDDCKLEIHLENATFSDSISSTKIINISSLKYGQSKDFIFKVKYNDSKNINVNYSMSSKRHNLKGTSVLDETLNTRFLEEHFRTQAICVLRGVIQKMKFNEKDEVRFMIESFIHSIKENQLCLHNKYIMNILYDFEGQIKEALNMTRVGEKEDWFSRWGKHYLRSLTHAYTNQLCNNFKDKAVSNFGGKLFKELVDTISVIFDNQPPPKKDINNRNYYTNTNYTHTNTPVNMSLFRNHAGGCCMKGSRIKMKDLSLRKVEVLKKGDSIITVSDDGKENISTIECVIRTYCNDNKQSMTELKSYIDGTPFHITPYHPVKQINKEKWIFPINIKEPEIVDCSEMYTFVIKNRQSVLIEDYVFATYGHGLRGNVIEHTYFGNSKIISDLQQISGYNEGLVCLTTNMFKRDKTNKIYKIEFNNYFFNINSDYIHNQYYISKI